MTIRAVYFDLGGVIVRTEDKAPRTKLGAEFGMSYEQIDAAVFGGGPHGSSARASIGAISEIAHWHNVTRRLGLPASEWNRIQTEFFAGDSIDWNIIAFLREVRKTHKTGLISNAWDGLRPWIYKQGFNDAFDSLTISAEARTAKPLPEIFHQALDSLGVKAEESIFVDDFIENIDACRKLGFHGVFFQSAEQALAEVRELIR
jgi:putative hydrolase of the HAD superfamily